VQSLLNRLVEHQRLGDRRSAVLALLIAQALWESVIVATRVGRKGAGPFTVTVGQFAIGLAVVLPLPATRALRPGWRCARGSAVRLYRDLLRVRLAEPNAHPHLPAPVAPPPSCPLRPPQCPCWRCCSFGNGCHDSGSLASACRWRVVLASGAAPSGGGSGALLGNALMALRPVLQCIYGAGRSLGAKYSAVLPRWPASRWGWCSCCRLRRVRSTCAGCRGSG
jgi:hypothetical protein